MPEEKKVRGRSLMPGQRNVEVSPDLLVSSVFDTFPEQRDNVVRVFDEEGRLTTREIGVKRFQFARLSPFHTLRSLPWSILITYSILLYLFILCICSLAYYMWSITCGAREGTTWVSALYFTVVSLAANGGYIGEHNNTMMQPGHICFIGRTFIVMALSYTNIIFVGLVAALVVGKAEYAGRLGQRVVFSDFCSLTAIPGRRDKCWRLTFRMANSIGQKPLAHGKLRVFIITAEPPQELRQRRKEMSRRYYERLIEKQHNRGQQLLSLNPMSPTTTTTTNRAAAPLTVEQLQEKQQEELGGGNKILNLSFPAQTDPALIAALSTRVQQEQEQQQKKQQRKKRSESNRRRRRRRQQQQNQQEQQPLLIKTHEGELEEIGTGTFSRGRRRRSSKRVSASTTAVDMTELLTKDISGKVTGAGGEEFSSSSDSDTSIKTNPSNGSRHAANNNNNNNNLIGGNEDNNDDFERVRMRVEELRWSCSEEQYLEARQGQLSLWFPVNITHTIDRQSPLYRYMENNMKLGGADVASPTLFTSPTTQQQKEKEKQQQQSTNLTSRTFQLVATFDATEMESGAIIMAKRTYTIGDIVAHYRFSNKMVRMRPGSNEVLLDYHYFNEMLPVTAIESSTTDSDGMNDN